MQITAMNVEPDFGALMIGTKAPDQPPKPSGMVHLDEMRHFMSGEIVEDEARREDKPPRIGQDAGGRTGTPAARLIAHRNPPDSNSEFGGVAPAGGFEVPLSLATQKIA